LVSCNFAYNDDIEIRGLYKYSHIPSMLMMSKLIIIIIIIIIIMQKEAEKKLKYNSLCIEIQRMWNLKCMIIPVIIGATGMVTRSLRKNLEAVPGKHSIDSLQKTAVLGTSHIMRKVLQCEA
jgi:hypothetical protein